MFNRSAHWYLEAQRLDGGMFRFFAVRRLASALRSQRDRRSMSLSSRSRQRIEGLAPGRGPYYEITENCRYMHDNQFDQ